MTRYFICFLSLYALSFFSCKEVLPDRVVQSSLVDTTYLKTSVSAPQDRNVLMEEFTGTKCANCPDGHAIVKTLKTNYADRLVAYGLHYGTLAEPARTGDEDFRTGAAEEVANSFGASSMPTALIDRSKNPSNSFIYGRGDWSTIVNARLTTPAKFNITGSVRFDNIQNKYILSYELECLQATTDPLLYSIVLTEDEIISSQLKGSTVLYPYTHFHVTRKFLTNSLGSQLKKASGKTEYEAGRTYKREVVLDLEPKWKPNKLSAVVFVSSETSREVLQAKEIKF